MAESSRQRVCVIGGGAAGLAASRHLVASPHLYDWEIYEQTSDIGGTWVYTDRVGLDDYGLPIHTSMYRNLRTNLPKEIMGYPDFPIPHPADGERSYLTAAEILAFLTEYARHFGVLPHIKFLHHVKLVEPEIVEGKTVWKVTVKNLRTEEETTSNFDAVMICNGHYHTPLYPAMKGLESFPGEISHSHDYRDPGRYGGQRVAVVGAGPSGIDLALEIASSAQHVIFSRHKQGEEVKNVFPSNVTMKFEIAEINDSKLIFEDGTTEEVDIIFFCTGYKYSFPFLSEKCGVFVEENCVQPLYKHLVHIKYPTLALIGLPYYVCAFSLFDLQVRFFLKTLIGEISLPTEEAMFADTEAEMEKRRKKGLKPKQFHMMGEMQGDYYAELAELGNLEPLPPVFANLHNFASQRHLENLIEFRDDIYKIVDNMTFLKVK